MRKPFKLFQSWFGAASTITTNPSIPTASAETTTALSYEQKAKREIEGYAADLDIHKLPDIFHYWSHNYVRPELEAFGYQDPENFFEVELARVMQEEPRAHHQFASLGSGNGDAEILIAQKLLARGYSGFCIDCLELTPEMNARTSVLAQQTGVSNHIRAIAMDLNRWQPEHRYAAIMANQSLHHMMELENIFDSVKNTLPSRGRFLVYDMIGRNGHQRWPEALAIVREFWSELPERYRYHLQLNREEPEFLDWDCSLEGFEGIRAQDILPLLCERFHFELFLPFANVIDPFIDRGFGHHFDANAQWDRNFIDRVHARDVRELLAGAIKPTHLFAVLTKTLPAAPRWRPGFNPEACIRR